MKIFYFSATGNSLYAAKKIGGDLYSIPQILEGGKTKFKDDAIGLAFPCYFWGIPRPVKEFLRVVTLESPYIFAVITMGNVAGGALKLLKKWGVRRGVQFSYMNELAMVDNYLPMFEMEDEIKKEEKKNIEYNLGKISADVQARRKYSPKKFFVLTILSHLAQAYYKTLLKKASLQFSVEDTCNSCGICAKVCPDNNISVDDKPVFGSHCESCFACTHHCPKNAIRVTKEKSRKRYVHQHIKTAQIAAAHQLSSS